MIRIKNLRTNEYSNIEDKEVFVESIKYNRYRELELILLECLGMKPTDSLNDINEDVLETFKLTTKYEEYFKYTAYSIKENTNHDFNTVSGLKQWVFGSIMLSKIFSKKDIEKDEHFKIFILSNDGKLIKRLNDMIVITYDHFIDVKLNDNKLIIDGVIFNCIDKEDIELINYIINYRTNKKVEIQKVIDFLNFKEQFNTNIYENNLTLALSRKCRKYLTDNKYNNRNIPEKVKSIIEQLLKVNNTEHTNLNEELNEFVNLIYKRYPNKSNTKKNSIRELGRYSIKHKELARLFDIHEIKLKVKSKNGEVIIETMISYYEHMLRSTRYPNLTEFPELIKLLKNIDSDEDKSTCLMSDILENIKLNIVNNFQ